MQTKENVINVKCCFFFLSFFLFFTRSFSISCRSNKFASMCTSVQQRYNPAVLFVRIFQLFASLGVEISFHCLASTLLFGWHITVEKKLDSYLSDLIWALWTTCSIQRRLFHCSCFCLQLSSCLLNLIMFFCISNALNSVDFIKNVAKSSFQLMRKNFTEFQLKYKRTFRFILVWKWHT